MSAENDPSLNTKEKAPAAESGIEIGERTKQLFGHCLEISRLEEGDRIPVGGTSIFSTKADIEITGDFKYFEQFFTEVHEMSDKLKLPKIREWLDEQELDIDEKLFATLFAFARKYEEKYPANSERAAERRRVYHERDREIKLSTLFENNAAECAEIAALAQFYLQQEGIASTYFNGDVLWNKDWEFSEEHSFIIIRQGDKNYIYDPSNPLVGSDSGRWPSIYTTELNFDEEMAKRQKRFVTARDILSKKEAFFGTNNGTLVLAEEHVV